MTRARLVAIVALAAATGGCMATSAYMRPLPPGPLLRPPPNLAQVVFIRPSSLAFGIKFTVINHEGRFLGDALPSSHFAVMLPPGRHVFIVWAENTAALEAELAPGRTYFVEVATRMGAFAARAHLLAITPRHPQWAERDAWLASTTRHQPDLQGGEAYLQARGPDTMERVRRGLEHLQNYDPEERAARTIVAPDGM